LLKTYLLFVETLVKFGFDFNLYFSTFVLVIIRTKSISLQSNLKRKNYPSCTPHPIYTHTNRTNSRRYHNHVSILFTQTYFTLFLHETQLLNFTFRINQLLFIFLTGLFESSNYILQIERLNNSKATMKM
jgi:hypothetical protein